MNDDKAEGEMSEAETAGFLLAQGVVGVAVGGAAAVYGEKTERVWMQALGGALLGGGATSLLAAGIRFWRLAKAKHEERRSDG